MSIEFERQMNAVLTEQWNHQNALSVRQNTPESLQKAGLDDLPMLYTGRHLLAALGDERAARHTHYISHDVMANLPELLEDPILIVDSDRRPDGVVILTHAQDMNGRPIAVAVSTGGRGTLEGKPVECNFITSVYGMNGIDWWISRQISHSNILFLDKGSLSEYVSLGYLDALYPGEDKQQVRLSHNVQKFDMTADDAPVRYFIDMDGTLAQFHAENNYLERMTEPGFFEDLQPFDTTLAKLKEYMAAHPNNEFFVLSGLTADAPDCEGQKNRWLDKYLPEIDAAHRIFTENGDDKSLYIPGGVHARDILLDDYNKNLEDWQAVGGAAVKFVNPVNDRALRGRRWEGERIRFNRAEDIPSVLGKLAANRSSKEVLRANLQRQAAEIAEGFRQDPAKIAEFLTFATRFYRYSARNMRLIWAQRPGAEYVAPARSFVAGLPDKDGNKLYEDKVFIKKGETALYIWRPTINTQALVDEKWKYQRELTKEQKKMFKEGKFETREYRSFTLAPVFDITQTTLPPERYPQLFGYGSFSQSAEDLSTALSAYSQAFLHCPVSVADFKGNATSLRGAFNPDLNCIKLSSMLSGEEKLSTLIHEIGHASLHADAAATGGKSTSQIELEADMYALMVQQHYGVEITDSRKAHLAEHYKRWLEGLSEEQRNDINADMPIFDNVCKRYGETIGTMDTYAERYTAYLKAEQEQAVYVDVDEPVPEAEKSAPTLEPEHPAQTQSTQEEPKQEDKPTKKWNISI